MKRYDLYAKDPDRLRTMLHRQAGPHRQREALAELGVAVDRFYVDPGSTGTNRARPGLNQAHAAVRKGDTLVVPKLNRLARSVPDARSIADGLAAHGVTFALGQSRYDPAAQPRSCGPMEC